MASKFGVVGLTQAMAFELAPHGITVNSVCPGYVATPMQDRELGWEAALRGTTEDTVRQLWIDDTPLGRLEAPQDVARAVAFLADPDARWRPRGPGGPAWRGVVPGDRPLAGPPVR